MTYYDENEHVLSEEDGLALLKKRRIIRETIIKRGVWVVTQFLVIMHGCLQVKCNCYQALYETKIRGGKMDGTIQRYHSKEEAISGCNSCRGRRQAGATVINKQTKTNVQATRQAVDTVRHRNIGRSQVC